MKFLLVAFLLCVVALCEANRDSASLRFENSLATLSQSLRLLTLPGRGVATAEGSGADAPLIVGINKAVDAIGQMVRSLLQILGLIPQESRPMHYCYGPQYRGY